MFLYTGYLNEGSSVLDFAKSKLNGLKEGMNPKSTQPAQVSNWSKKKRESLVNQKWEKLR